MSLFLKAFKALRTQSVLTVRIAPEPATFDDINLWQKVCEGSHKRGLAGPLGAGDENTTNPRIDSVQYQCQFQVIKIYK